MPRRSGLTLALAALLVTACDSPQPLSASEYFAAVEEELARLEQATKDLTDRYAAELEDEIDGLIADTDLDDDAQADRLVREVFAAAKANSQAILAAHAGQLDVFVVRTSGLLPPDLIVSNHDELVAAMDGWAASGEPTVRRLEAAQDMADLVDLLVDSPYSQAQVRVDAACTALVPNAANVEVTLTCPGTRLPLFTGGAGFGSRTP